MAITGTNIELTRAVRWMPPKTMLRPAAASTMPTHNGDQPKACCIAPQMVFDWMELYDSPKVMVIRMAKSTDIHRQCRPRWI